MTDLQNNNNLTGYEIAVIGMAGRFPGAASIEEFWENLKTGKRTIRFFTAEELIAAGVEPGLLENPNYVKAKGMLEDVDFFDASFFNYTLPEAEIMDPQLRILHECSWQALEDAGYNPDTYEGRIGFYVGAGTHYYWISRMLNRVKNQSENFALISLNDGYSVSTQVAYRLNLKGPALTLQTACSTSLVAIHCACQALLSGECDMVLAGGVSVKLPAKGGYIYQENMVFSRDGRCRPFDEKACGTVDGNGVGIVVLKTLDNAAADRDFIYALVKGTAVNNDGKRRAGYSAPSVIGQSEVIRMAQQAADVHPESITYVEAHGTATPLGDPVEIRALTRAFASEKRQFCRVGAVKSNIGHLDAAAGVAGFIKTVLALRHRLIPLSLDFETPNPEIDFENSPFYVNTELTEWLPDPAAPPHLRGPLRAGVSSFGIGGTNAHAVLEEWPVDAAGHAAAGTGGHRLIVLSARTEAALERNTANLVKYLTKKPGLNFADVASTLQAGRKPFEYRRTLVCRETGEAVKLLSDGNSKKVRTGRVKGENPPLIFMFPGLGSQYVNMGRELYRDEPLFRQEMEHCFEMLKPLVDYDLKDVLYPRQHSTHHLNLSIQQADVAQLVIFTFEYALTKLLMAWGIKPTAMTGYSFGEYTAACAAGVFTLADALKLIVERGRLIAKTRRGAMLSVPLHSEEIRPLLEQGKNLSLAIDNGSSCIIAGGKGAVDEFASQMKQKKCLCMPVNTYHAIHSSLMNSIAGEFTQLMSQIPLNEPRIPYISNLSGDWITAAETTDPAYWAKHLTNTVRFADGMAELLKEPQAIFVEIGPGRDLSTMIQRSLQDNQHTVNLVKPEGKKIEDTAYLLDRAGVLWLYGTEIDWKRFYHSRGEDRHRVPLPSYSFERQQFTLDGAVQPMLPETEPGIVRKHKRSRLPDDFEAPRGEVEEKIAAAFQNIFGLDTIGSQEDFFELGGDSLKVITLITSIHQQLDVDIPMEIVFTNPTVKELAAYIGNRAGTNVFSVVPPVEKREYYPLSPSQKRVFVVEQIEEKGMAYNMPSIIWLEGEVDTRRLEEACRRLLARHESLRTGFFLKAGEPVQKVYPTGEIDFEIEYYDIDNNREVPGIKPAAQHPVLQGQQSGSEGHSPGDIIERFVRPFDLSSPPLWRIGLARAAADKYLLLNSIHHIVSDDISIGVMINEFSGFYRGESFAELPVQYKEYAVWLEETVTANRALKEQRDYWLNHFSGNLPLLNMPLDYPRPVLQTFTGDHIEFKIDLELTNRLADLARKNKATLFVLFFTIYITLLYRYTGQEDIIVGTPITGRSHRDLQQVLGMFVNTLALRSRPRGDKTFAAFLQDVKEETLQAFANQSYQFEDLVEELDIRRDMSRNPLFDTMFVLHTVNLEKIDIPGVKLYSYEFEHLVSRFDFTLNIAEFSQGLNVVIEYSTSLFKDETMHLFRDNLVAIARTVVENPQVTLDEIELKKREFNEAERNRLLYEFNDTDAKYPGDKTIYELFAGQVSRTPGNTALIGNSAASGSSLALSYGEFNEKLKRLAHFLKKKGVKPGAIVVILADRTIEMMVGMFGILKAGGAYLPVEPAYPRERIEYIINDSGARLLLTTRSLKKEVEKFRSIEFETVFVEDCRGEALAFCSGNECFAPTSELLAYVIYTSGSTGKPKGVMIEHRSLINRLHWMQKAYPIDEKDVLLQKTPIVFDVSLWELFWWSFQGAAVCLLEPGGEKNPESIISAVASHNVTVIHFVPSMLNIFMEYLAASAEVNRLRSLRRVFASGEALAVQHVTRFHELLTAANGTELVNLYGPTEATVDVSYFNCSPEETYSNIPIGKPIDNTRFYIVDEHLQLQPLGTPGELCISGVNLARGYLNNPELTEEKFVDFASGGSEPFCKKVPTPPKTFDNNKSFSGGPGGRFYKKAPLVAEGIKLYKTGDLARWLPDGNVEFLGRVDHQVKIRGFRIEPGEIESQLIKHDAVKEAAVLAKEDSNGEKYLYAYLALERELQVAELREYLSKELPDYMVPSFYMKIDSMPLTTSGKINRNALSAAEGLQPLLGTAYTAPATGLEKNIAQTWQKILNADKVGIDDNFFDIGGNSLKVIRIVSELKEVLKRDIPVVTMFRYPTIRSLAKFLNQGETVTRKDRSRIKQKGRERVSMKRSLRTAQ